MNTWCHVIRISVVVCVAAFSWSAVHAQISQGWFDDFRPVPGLNSRYRDKSPFVTRDGRTIYFASDRPSSPQTVDFSSFDIWMASRQFTSEPFGEPVKLDAPINRSGTGDSDPFLTDDGLRLFFSTDSDDGTSDIMMTRRDGLSAPWGELVSLGPAVNDPKSLEFSPSMTPDGLTIFFTSTRTNADQTERVLEGDLFQATRASRDQPFGSVAPLENVNTIFDTEKNSSISSDGLTLFYDTRRGPWGWEELWVATRSSTSEPFDNPMTLNDLGLGSTLNDETAIEGTPFISPDWPAPGSKLYYMRTASETDWDIWEATWYVEGEVIPEPSPLVAGDADQDLDFDQLDLVRAQIAAKYLTGQSATWGEGDWNGAPGGAPGNPPQGDGRFDQLDIIASLNANAYLTGPYGAIAQAGTRGDGQTSIIYDAGSGEVAVDSPAGIELTSINIVSVAVIFTGDAAQNLGGSFDNDGNNNIFKATFGGSFGSISFGNVAQSGLSEQFVAGDLSVVGSLAGGGALGTVDLVYVPEPSSIMLLLLGFIGWVKFGRDLRAKCWKVNSQLVRPSQH